MFCKCSVYENPALVLRLVSYHANKNFSGMFTVQVLPHLLSPLTPSWVMSFITVNRPPKAQSKQHTCTPQGSFFKSNISALLASWGGALQDMSNFVKQNKKQATENLCVLQISSKMNTFFLPLSVSC